MNEDEQMDSKLEKQEDMARDSRHEEMLRKDYEYAVDDLDLAQTIHNAIAKLHDLGWYPTYNELLEDLKE